METKGITWNDHGFCNTGQLSHASAEMSSGSGVCVSTT